MNMPAFWHKRQNLNKRPNTARKTEEKLFLELWLNNLLLRYCYYKRNLACDFRCHANGRASPKSQIVAPFALRNDAGFFLPCRTAQRKSGCLSLTERGLDFFCRKQIFARCASQKCVPLASNPCFKGVQKGTHLQPPRFKAHNAALCQTEIKK